MMLAINSDIIIKIKSGKMTSNQVEINFMITRLKEWNQTLGGAQAKRSTATSQFDFLQEEFLSRRHKVEKYQDIKEKEGITAANAHVGQGIRDGIDEMKELLTKLKDEERRLVKKKKDTPEILSRKHKIVQNCELLLKDIEQRQVGNIPQNRYKATTLTDMKAKLLNEIDENNDKIHERNSDGALSEAPEDRQQIGKWEKEDQQIDVLVDEIGVNVKGLKKKVKNIVELQDVVEKKQKPIENKIDAGIKRLKRDNDQLKNIIQKFKPNRCCLFIALFLLLAGLIVCIIKVLI